MNLPTLDEFVARRGAWPNNSYVREPGFESLYVRYTSRSLGNAGMKEVLDVANVTAKKPGGGAFTRLIGRLRTQYPTLGLYVECVHNERFAATLTAKLGFQENEHSPGSYYWLPQQVSYATSVDERK